MVGDCLSPQRGAVPGGLPASPGSNARRMPTRPARSSPGSTRSPSTSAARPCGARRSTWSARAWGRPPAIAALMVPGTVRRISWPFNRGESDHRPKRRWINRDGRHRRPGRRPTAREATGQVVTMRPMERPLLRRDRRGGGRPRRGCAIHHAPRPVGRRCGGNSG